MPSPRTFSFELFPPRTAEGAAKLPGVIAQLAALRPDYFSITHGANGSQQEGTYETLLTVVEHTGVEAAPHLTCVGSTRAHIAAHLQRYREAGVKRIVALRGDMPATAHESRGARRISYANELVSFIRETHGDAFKIEVAAYPEMHPQAASPAADFEHFRRKVEAGADVALTQLFYNADAYFDFVERCGQGGHHDSHCAGHHAHHRATQTPCAFATAAAPTCRAGCACAWRSWSTTRRRWSTSGLAW